MINRWFINGFTGTLVGAIIVVTVMLCANSDEVQAHMAEDANIVRELAGIKSALSKPIQVQCDCRCPR